MEELTSAVIQKLRDYLFHHVPEAVEAEEIFQETLIAAAESLPTYKGKSSFFTWLCAIANHEIADFYRKKKLKTLLFSHFPFLEDLVSQALGPEEELLKKELRKEVKKTLSGLTEGYSQILRLKYYQGLSVKEIARKLHLTIKAAESRLSRARLAFQKEWVSQNLKI